MFGYWCAVKRNRQVTSASQLQATKSSVHSEATTYQFKFGDGVFSSLGRMLIRISTPNEWMSYPEMYRYFSVSIYWKTRDSWRTMFRTSYKLQIVVCQCLSLVSMGTSISHGIRNHYYSPSRKLSSASSVQAYSIWKIVQSYEKCTTESSWRGNSTTVVKDYQGVWDLPKIQRSSTTLWSLATAIWFCFQLWRCIRTYVDWNKDVLHVVDIETGFNSASFLFYQTVESV